MEGMDNMKKIFVLLALLALTGLSSAMFPQAWGTQPQDMGWNNAPSNWDQGYYQPQYPMSMGWYSYPNGSYWGIEINSANYNQYGQAPYQQYQPGIGWTQGYTTYSQYPPRLY
jgi:hypothetical protein